jgi:hypothetical protein
MNNYKLIELETEGECWRSRLNLWNAADDPWSRGGAGSGAEKSDGGGTHRRLPGGRKGIPRKTPGPVCGPLNRGILSQAAGQYPPPFKAGLEAN